MIFPDCSHGVLMKTKWIMITSSSMLLAHGIVLLFAPELLFKIFDLSSSLSGSATAQLFAAALIGMGVMNWTARGIVLGGIYGRALVFGNFAFFFIGLFVAIRARLDGFGNQYFWIEVVLYIAFAIAFGLMLFRGPAPQTTGSS
jgi:hypothetical protein